ncbi:MAG TPA: ABC transporter ATP-binding protein [Bryobacteraceae bacterium]|nr:ABC transporter ATP-binding protein [Bryobacteraceae bacterium]
MNPVLEFLNISRSFKRGAPVLDGVSFSMAEGEVVGLLGRNGAGKTTLIHIAMGLLSTHGGAVRVFGVSPFDNPVAVKRRVGFVSEEQVLPPRSTIAELITFHRYLFGRWDDVLERQLLDRFALSPSSKIHSLSKGQARQVALLCAVCHRPELLLLDEPAGGLDPVARREFLETSIQLLNREGTAILFSSHHMADVERIGGRIVLLSEGRVAIDRDLDRLREDVCIAMVPRASAPDPAALRNLPGCLRIRAVFEDWHVVIEGQPDDVLGRLQLISPADNIRCMRVPLEELFIELMGGER